MHWKNLHCNSDMLEGNNLQSEFVGKDQEVAFSGIVCRQNSGTEELMWAMLNDADKVEHAKIWEEINKQIRNHQPLG